MTRTRHAPLALILMAVLSACSDSDTSTPIAPSAPPSVPVPPGAPAPPRGPGTGTIAIRELSPAPGTTLAVLNCPAGSVTRICTEQWRGIFDVLVDREMTNAVLTVSFYDGQRICGYGANTSDIVPAGERVSFTLSWILLSDDRTLRQPCQLPIRTNRIEAELWSDSSAWTNTLVQVFEQSYTFSAP
jgi:hypothetical protein